MEQNKSTIECPNCGRTFASDAALSAHQSAKGHADIGTRKATQTRNYEDSHTESGVDTEIYVTTPFDSPYRCSACGYQFPEKVRECPLCKASFDWNAER